MNCYEHTIITKSDLSENQSKKLIEKYLNAQIVATSTKLKSPRL